MSPRSKTASEHMKRLATGAILDAAERVFAVAGLHSATTAMVAERAGVSKGLVFNYFATKDDLLAAVVERRLADQLAFWRTLELTGPARSRLRAIVDRALDCVIAHPDAHRIYFALLLQPGGSRAVQRAVDAMKPAIADYFTLLERLFRELGSAQPHVQALAFQSAVNGVAYTLTIQPDVARKPNLYPLDLIKAEIVAAFARQRAVSKPSHSRKART